MIDLWNQWYNEIILNYYKILVCGILLFSFSFSIMISLYFLCLNKELIFGWNIYSFNSIKFNFLLIVDYKSLIFIFLIRIIFSIIIIYRVRYIDLSEL